MAVRPAMKSLAELSQVEAAGMSLACAMRELRDALGSPVEPSSAVPYAAILEGQLKIRGRRTGIILTGGNSLLPGTQHNAHDTHTHGETR